MNGRALRLGFGSTLLGALAAGGLSLARAEEPMAAPRLGVSVKGHAALVADTVEVELTVTGASDEDAEAQRLHQQRLKKVLTALRSDTGRAKGKTKKTPPAPRGPQGPQAGPPKGMPTPPPPPPARAKPSDEDDDDDATPAPRKTPRREPSDGDEKEKTKADENEGAKKPASADESSEPSKDAPAIPVEVTERGLLLAVKSTRGDENPMQKMIAAQLGQGQAKVENPMTCSSKVVATIRNVKTLDRAALASRLAGLVDAAIEAGADGPETTPPAVRFLLGEDAAEELRHLAYKDAMTRARRRAGELAELAGGKLGAVFSVQELAPVPGSAEAKDPAAQTQNAIMQMYGMGGSTGGGGAAASPLEVSSDVELRVEFALEGGPGVPAKGATGAAEGDKK